MVRSRSSLAILLFGLSAVLIGFSWWFLQRSVCAGDLKQGLGDVEAALALEGQAFIAHFAGALLLAFGVSVAKPLSIKWVYLATWLSFLPLTYLAFVGLSLLAAGDLAMCTVSPNQSIERTASGTLRVPPASAHLQR